MRLHNAINMIGWGNTPAGQNANVSRTASAESAANQAIERAKENDPNFRVDRVRLVVTAGLTAKNRFLSFANLLQNRLGISDTECFDISAAHCSGTQALIQAARALQVGHESYALVATGEIAALSPTGSDNDGMAVVVCSSSDNKNLGVLGWHSRCNNDININSWDVEFVANELESLLEENRITVNDRTYLLPDTDNPKMIEALGGKAGFPPCRILGQIAARGNYAYACALSTFTGYANAGFFQKEDLLVLASFSSSVRNYVPYRWG